MLLRSLAISALLLLASIEAKIFVTIPANDEACFEELVDDNVPGLKGFFEVIEGGQLDIDVSVTKDDRIVHTLQYAKQGDLDIMKGPGRYRVCFGNTMSSVTSKHVGFSLHGSLGELIEDEDIAKKDDVRPINIQVHTLADKIQRLQEIEHYLTERLQRHMQTAESTSARVIVSTGIEAAVLVFVNLGQIWYLRRYFERRRTL